MNRNNIPRRFLEFRYTESVLFDVFLLSFFYIEFTSTEAKNNKYSLTKNA